MLIAVDRHKPTVTKIGHAVVFISPLGYWSGSFVLAPKS
jgi:hypothetical protein